MVIQRRIHRSTSQICNILLSGRHMDLSTLGRRAGFFDEDFELLGILLSELNWLRFGRLITIRW